MIVNCLKKINVCDRLKMLIKKQGETNGNYRRNNNYNL